MGGHAETQGFPMVFGGSRGQPVRMCGMHELTEDLLGHVIVSHLIWVGFGVGYVTSIGNVCTSNIEDRPA